MALEGHHCLHIDSGFLCQLTLRSSQAKRAPPGTAGG